MLSRQVSKSSTENQDLAREREVLLDKLRAAEQVLLQLPCVVYAIVMTSLPSVVSPEHVT